MSEYSEFRTFLSVRIIQRHLNRWSVRYGNGKTIRVDGDLGAKTFSLFMDYSKAQENLPEGFMRWPKQRRYIAAQQLLLKELGYNPGSIDGYYGPNTDAAKDTWQLQLLSSDGHVTPEEHETWPYERNCPDYYGAIGTNHTLLTLPYAMKLTWKPSEVVKRITINSKCAESAERVLKNVLSYYGLDKIRYLGLDMFSGCYNPRYKRNGHTWSMHAFACAIDFYDTQNQYHWHDDKAVFAKPEYDKWWEFWEEEGWVSLGRERNFDWMHVQAARI